MVAAKGDEVVIALLLVSFETDRHALGLGYRVRASRECPHLRIEMWGTHIFGQLDVGHPSSLNVWATRPHANK